MGTLDDRARLEGKTAVVIGGAEGLGDVSLALARAGVDVALCDVNAEALDVRADEIRQLGRLKLSETLDVRDPETLDRFYSNVDDVVEKIDIVVNVAGGVERQRFVESTEEEWERDAQWNLYYVARSSKNAISRMMATSGGSIVNVTTIEAHRACPGFAMYGAFKAGVTSLTRTLAVEYGQIGVRVNCVAPDITPTPGVGRNLSRGSHEPPGFSDEGQARAPELEAARAGMYIPLARVGVPDDVTNCILFLASDLASYVTGQTIHCDGGAWASSGWMRYPVSGFLPWPGRTETERMFPSGDPLRA